MRWTAVSFYAQLFSSRGLAPTSISLLVTCHLYTFATEWLPSQPAPGVGGWATKICSNPFIFDPLMLRTFKESKMFTCIKDRWHNPCVCQKHVNQNIPNFQSVIPSSMKSKKIQINQKDRTRKQSNWIFQIFFVASLVLPTVVFPGHNFRVHAKASANTGAHTGPQRVNPGGSRRGRVTPRGEPVTRIMVRNRTNITSYLLTKTQSQQVASAY